MNAHTLRKRIKCCQMSLHEAPAERTTMPKWLVYPTTERKAIDQSDGFDIETWLKTEHPTLDKQTPQQVMANGKGEYLERLATMISAIEAYVDGASS